MANKLELWECPLCRETYETETEADLCHFDGLEIRSVKDIHLGVDWKKEIFYLKYELVLWFKDSEIKLILKNSTGKCTELLEVLFAGKWFSDNVISDDDCLFRFMTVLDERYDEEIYPLFGDITFEIPLPPK